jgi:hypothetical protein
MLLAWLARLEVTVSTCGDWDTCATVRLERLPQGKPGDAYEGQPAYGWRQGAVCHNPA